MWRYFLIVLASIALSGCTLGLQSENANTQRNPEKVRSQYHEVGAELPENEALEAYPAQVDSVRGTLEKAGNFWSAKSDVMEEQSPILRIYANLTCQSLGSNCTAPKLTIKHDLSPGLTLGSCNSEDFCTIESPSFSASVLKKLSLDSEFYGNGSTLYAVSPTKDRKLVSIFTSSWEIFSHALFQGNEGYLENINLIAGSPAFAFSETNDSGSTVRNIFYNGKTFNETYHLEESFYPFSFQGKVGFVGVEHDKAYVFFEGKKVSQGFDEIRPKACCAIPSFPFEVHANGILLFMGRRDKQYIFGEINLNAKPLKTT